MEILKELKIPKEHSGTFCGEWVPANTFPLSSQSPVDASCIGSFSVTSANDYDRTAQVSAETFSRWSQVPAPKRGLIIREIAETLRAHKSSLAELLSFEMGKIRAEAEGEVQEAIDIADYAVGLSRQLYGLSMHSERPQHRMYEQWHPIGPVGVITAFNFPVAVWAWNAMIAAVCGDTVIWKPSELTPAVSVATTKLVSEITTSHGFPGLFTMLTGDAAVGKWLADDRRIPLISATGSCRMGRAVGKAVAQRLGRSLLELGGNNALIVLADASLDLAVRAVLFGALGTSGQRCTTTRRVLVERSIADSFTKCLVQAYEQVRIGDPLRSDTLMGPLISSSAVEAYKNAVSTALREGAQLLTGGKIRTGLPSSLYVEPTIFIAPRNLSLLQEETFAPILYVVEVDGIEDAIAVNNVVPQGLSSAIFTESLRSAEQFLCAQGSDCGIANVNIGTSGAEIGGAFGGEKDTGGGREAGSDAWKAYMRRQTTTINWSRDLPFAQGIRFE